MTSCPLVSIPFRRGQLQRHVSTSLSREVNSTLAIAQMDESSSISQRTVSLCSIFTFRQPQIRLTH